MKISTTWSSSRMATRVSWAPEEMIISLFMDQTPAAEHRDYAEQDYEYGDQKRVRR
jgi:hypothetical protein